MKLSTFYEFLNPSIYDDPLFKEESIENGHSTTETDWKGKEVTDNAQRIMNENAKLFYTPEEEQSGKVNRVLSRLESLGFQVEERFPYILRENIAKLNDGEKGKDDARKERLERECVAALDKVFKWKDGEDKERPTSVSTLVRSIINVYETTGKITSDEKKKQREDGGETEKISKKVFYKDRIILRFQYHTVVSQCADYWDCQKRGDKDCFMLARFVHGHGDIKYRAHVCHTKDAELKKKLFSSPHVKKSTIKELNDLDYIVWLSIGVGADKKLGPVKTYKEAKARLAQMSRFSS